MDKTGPSMKPRITSTGMGHVIVFDDRGEEGVIRFEVEDVERVPWGLAATITARTRITGARTLDGGFLTHERINLLSSRSRRDLASRIEALVPHPAGAGAAEWERVVEQVANLVMAAEKDPPLLIDLSTSTPTREEHYLVPALLPMGKPTILFAPGGTGKSILAAGIAAAVQSGTSFMGWHVEQANVLYLDWETDEGDLANRVAMVSKGLGLRSPAPVGYIHMSGPLERQQAAIANIVAGGAIGLVIIDSVGMATVGAKDGGDQGENAIRFFRSLRALNTAVLAVDHVSSEVLMRKGTGPTKPFGSVYKINSARNTFELRDASEDGGPHRVTLKHQKSNLMRKIEDITIVIDWTEDRVTFRRDTEYVRTVRPLDDRIMGVVTAGPITLRGLVEVLNEEPGEDRVSEWEVRNEIKTLKAVGLVEIGTDGTVGIPAGVEPEPDLGLTEREDDDSV